MFVFCSLNLTLHAEQIKCRYERNPYLCCYRPEGVVSNLHREANEEIFMFLRRMCFLDVFNVRACLLFA